MVVSNSFISFQSIKDRNGFFKDIRNRLLIFRRNTEEAIGDFDFLI